eukprot:TRINITY_DN13757_c0_g1_i1.p1 TRINITY_DN13757_c0_g1~~TRINITY_DN13757_c0_g1_i1.p1  ORF type:complete len:359 (+),score=18.17 TRINITY_DN13757_c0_g1_i1:167-1243(+)
MDGSREAVGSEPATLDDRDDGAHDACGPRSQCSASTQGPRTRDTYSTGDNYPTGGSSSSCDLGPSLTLCSLPEYGPPRTAMKSMVSQSLDVLPNVNTSQAQLKRLEKFRSLRQKQAKEVFMPTPGNLIRGREGYEEAENMFSVLTESSMPYVSDVNSGSSPPNSDDEFAHRMTDGLVDDWSQVSRPRSTSFCHHGAKKSAVALHEILGPAKHLLETGQAAAAHQYLSAVLSSELGNSTVSCERSHFKVVVKDALPAEAKTEHVGRGRSHEGEDHARSDSGQSFASSTSTRKLRSRMVQLAERARHPNMAERASDICQLDEGIMGGSVTSGAATGAPWLSVGAIDGVVRPPDQRENDRR